MIDLQGHGESSGEAITIGYLEKHDIRAAVAFARNEHPGEPVAVIGVSLGGAAAVLGSPLDIDALVIESVYPNVSDAIGNRVSAILGPFAAIPTALLTVQLKPRLGISPSQLRPIDFMSKLECPVFVLSGTQDVHTTEQETLAMFDTAVEPKELWLVDGAAHVDLQQHVPEEYRKRVLSFLETHLD